MTETTINNCSVLQHIISVMWPWRYQIRCQSK